MYSGNMGMDSHDMMDIDSCRPRIALSMSYNSGSQPPSIGDVRQIDVSEPSSGIPMDSDGQPPSVNDVGRREASQSEASFTRYEDPDALEVQQCNLELQLACDGSLVNSSAARIPEDPCDQIQQRTDLISLTNTMGSTPSCETNDGLRKGQWTIEEDFQLINYICIHGEKNWRKLPKYAGLQRSGNSCRLRWMNYLNPSVRRDNLSDEEKEKIIQLHSELGNKWSTIAAPLRGRTDNEIKNFFNNHLRKRSHSSPPSKTASPIPSMAVPLRAWRP